MHFDLIVRGGMVVDGTGAEPIRADVAIEGERIAAIGDLVPATGGIVLDAQGAIVAPGFIDTHTHSDTACFLPSEAEDLRTAALRQGVTTEVCGNCGFTPYPILPETRSETAKHVRGILASSPLDWSTVAEYADRVERQGLFANLAPLVGHGSLRTAVMGFTDRRADAHDLRMMKDLLRASLEQGAFGLSSGLIYPPGAFAPTEELIELAGVAADFGRPYCTHMRGETDMVARSVAEALEVGRTSGAAVHISHHKVAGRANWGRTHQTLALMDEARRTGQDVSCDVYPYTAGSTVLHALLPSWVQAGGLDTMFERLRDRVSRERIVRELDEPSFSWENMVRAAGWDHIRIATCPGRPKYEGQTLTDLALDAGKTPADFTFDLIVEERGMATMILELMHEDDVRRVIAYEGATIGSDGIPLPGKPHPRWAGAFARVLGRYARQERLLPLADAVHKMTGMAADRFGLRGRGRVSRDMLADLVVFDPDRILDQATYDEPLLSATGIRHVVVNGVPAVVDGALTGRLPGRVLRAA